MLFESDFEQMSLTGDYLVFFETEKGVYAAEWGDHLITT